MKNNEELKGWMIVDNRNGEIISTTIYLNEYIANDHADREPMICCAKVVPVTVTFGDDNE